MAAALSSATFLSARTAVQGKTLKASRAAPVAKRAAFKVQASTGNARVDACSKDDIIVSPSILSANFACLGDQVRFDRIPMRKIGGYSPQLTRERSSVRGFSFNG